VQDLERGRPMEIDTLYEIPLALARNIGVATPTLDLVGSEARLHFDSDRTPRAAQLPDLPRGREREAVVEKEILRNARSAHAPEYAGAAHTMRLSGSSGISRTSANDSEECTEDKFEQHYTSMLAVSKDGVEARQAFLEKRPPRFSED
jgi:hypothetical protein